MVLINSVFYIFFFFWSVLLDLLSFPTRRSSDLGAGLAHGADDLVQRDKVPAIAAQGHACSVDDLYRAHGVALDAGHLDQAVDRVAGQAEVVLRDMAGRARCWQQPSV